MCQFFLQGTLYVRITPFSLFFALDRFLKELQHHDFSKIYTTPRPEKYLHRIKFWSKSMRPIFRKWKLCVGKRPFLSKITPFSLFFKLNRFLKELQHHDSSKIYTTPPPELYLHRIKFWSKSVWPISRKWTLYVRKRPFFSTFSL